MKLSQEKLSEVFKTMSDKTFMETFFLVVDKARNEVPFILNSIQQKLEDAWADMNVVLKARKVGISTLVQNKFLARVLRKKNRNSVILSFDREDSQRHLEMTEWTLNHLPFPVNLERDSKSE